jgi:molybdopterin-guanine dinucleotide biosynthesis protein
VELLRGGSGEGKAKAAKALRSLALNKDVKVAAVAAGALPPLVELLRVGSDEGRAKAAATLRVISIGNNAT